MKKKQRIITSNNLDTFHEYVKQAFDEGWVVVPGTVVASVSRGASNSGMLLDIQVFVMVVEKANNE